MSQLPNYLKDRSLERNVIASVVCWDKEDKYGFSNCSSCCFRNWRKFCTEMPCNNNDKGTVYWDAVHLPQNDVITLINHFKKKGGDTKDLAETKKAELFKFLESGKTIQEWTDKKYHDAWKDMGRS